MPITVKQGKSNPKPYNVSGTTLAEIWADIEKKGPKSKGKSRAGMTTCKVKMNAASGKFEFTTKEGKKKKEFESEAKMTKGTLTATCDIRMPNLKSDKDLSKKAKAEWARFMKELEAHENEHVTEFGKEADKIGKEITDLAATGTGADEKKAEKAAHKEYGKLFNQKFGEAEIDKRMDANADALDSGGHGPTLDTSIP